jgi:hypothetical protein
MKRVYLCLMAGILLFGMCLFAAATLAQQENGGKQGGFQKGHETKFQLMRLVQNVGRLDSGKNGKITPDQAKTLLGILDPLRKQDILTQDQAKVALDKISALLTDEQQKLIADMKPEKNSGGTGGGGFHNHEGGMMGGGGPHQNEGGMMGGGGPHQHEAGMMGGGGSPQANPGAMENMNPFNPPKDSPMAKNISKQMDKIFKQLEKTAKNSK